MTDENPAKNDTPAICAPRVEPSRVILAMLQGMGFPLNDGTDWEKMLPDDKLDLVHNRMSNALLATQEAAWRSAKDALPQEDTRNRFLDYIIEGAMESGSYGDWMIVEKYNTAHYPNGELHSYYTPANAVIIDTGGDELTEAEVKAAEQFTINHELIEKALYKIRHHDHVEYLDKALRDSIRQADLLNEAGNLDVIGYLAILEIAIFGKVMYA